MVPSAVSASASGGIVADRLESGLRRAGRIRIEPEHLREPGAAGAGELEPICLGRGHGALVRHHHPLLEPAQPHPADEPGAGEAAPLRREDLLVAVERGHGVPPQRAGSQPVAIGARGVLVARIAFSFGQDEPDRIVRAPLEQRLAVGGGDGVVGRSEQRIERPRPGGVEEHPAQGRDGKRGLHVEQYLARMASLRKQAAIRLRGGGGINPDAARLEKARAAGVSLRGSHFRGGPK